MLRLNSLLKNSFAFMLFVVGLTLLMGSCKKNDDQAKREKAFSKGLIQDFDAANKMLEALENKGFIGGSDLGLDSLKQAITLYKDYKRIEAIQFFHRYLISNPSDANATFLLGRCYMDDAKYSKALEYFSKAHQMEGLEFKDELYYQDALIRIKLDVGKTSAINMLKKIAGTENSKYQSSAKGVLELMGENY
jgi:tetratricopeptide (TPR) repeat protein